MSEYRLEISGDVSLSDYSSIYDYMSIVDVEDKFTIKMDPKSASNEAIICSMLQDDNFTIISRGGDGSGKISITALRNRQIR